MVGTTDDGPALRVHVVGAGMIGTSIALALASTGLPVSVEDVDAGHAQQARDRIRAVAMAPSARRPPASCTDRHLVVVVAVPPAVTASVVKVQQSLHLDSTIMDVASVKTRVVAEMEASGSGQSNFVPTHPLGGRETPGPADASADLLVGRAWVLTPHPATAAHHVQAVVRVIRLCRATPVWLDATAHDAAVAVTSHLPQIVSSMLAAELLGLDRDGTSVAGPALVDMTRVAASPGPLWGDIVVSNRHNVLAAVTRLGSRLEGVRRLLAEADDPALDAGVQRLLAEGRRGRALLSAKHPGAGAGGVAGPGAAIGAGMGAGAEVLPGPPAPSPGAADRSPVPAPHQGATDGGATDGGAIDPVPGPTHWLDVPVVDRPGGLAALFALAAAMDVDIKDIRLDHAPHERSALVGLELTHDDSIRLRKALSIDV